MTETYSGLPVFEVYLVAPCGSMWLHAPLKFILRVSFRLTYQLYRMSMFFTI